MSSNAIENQGEEAKVDNGSFRPPLLPHIHHQTDIKTHHHHATPHIHFVHAYTPTGVGEAISTKAGGSSTSSSSITTRAMATTGGGSTAGGGGGGGGGGEGVILLRDEFLSLCLNHAEVSRRR